MSGDECAEIMHGVNPDVQVIFCTAYTPDRATVARLEPHVSAFIKKPLDLEWLLTSVRRALGRDESEQPADAGD